MIENDLKSSITDRLAEKYGKVCSICGEPDELIVYYIHGQEYLESEYFDSLENRYLYYLEYFDEESDFLGLVHKQCKPDYKPNQPTLEQTMNNINEIIRTRQFPKMDEFIQRYPHISPILARMYREGISESTQEEIHRD